MRVNQKIVSDTKNSSELLIIDICWDTMRLAVTELLLVSPKRPFTLSLDEVENDISQGRRHIADHDFPKIIYEADNNLNPNWIKKCARVIIKVIGSELRKEWEEMFKNYHSEGEDELMIPDFIDLESDRFL